MYKRNHSKIEDSEFHGYIYDNITTRYYKNNEQNRKNLKCIEGAIIQIPNPFTIYCEEYIENIYYDKKYRFKYILPDILLNIFKITENQDCAFKLDIIQNWSSIKVCFSKSQTYCLVVLSRNSEIKLMGYNRINKQVKQAVMQCNSISKIQLLVLQVGDHNFKCVIATQKSISTHQIDSQTFAITCKNNTIVNHTSIPIQFCSQLYFLTQFNCIVYQLLNDSKIFQLLTQTKFTTVTQSEQYLFGFSTDLRLFVINHEKRVVASLRVGLKFLRIYFMTSYNRKHYLMVEASKNTHQIIEVNIQKKDCRIIDYELPMLQNPCITSRGEIVIIWDKKIILIIDFNKSSVYKIENRNRICRITTHHVVCESQTSLVFFNCNLNP